MGLNNNQCRMCVSSLDSMNHTYRITMSAAPALLISLLDWKLIASNTFHWECNLLWFAAGSEMNWLNETQHTLQSANRVCCRKSLHMASFFYFKMTSLAVMYLLQKWVFFVFQKILEAVETWDTVSRVTTTEEMNDA